SLHPSPRAKMAADTGRRKRFAVLEALRQHEPRLLIGPDRQGFGRDRNAELRAYCRTDNKSDNLDAILSAALGTLACGAWAIRGGLALPRRSDDSGGNNQGN